MTVTVKTDGIVPEQPVHSERPLMRSIRRGLFNTCPACGEGKLFRAYLKPVKQCDICQEDMSHERSDDLPPYLVVFILGHVMLGGYMMTDTLFPHFYWWAHLVIWVPLSVVVALLILQPIKGGVIGLQWSLRMHGFSGSEDDIDPVDDR
jgi:uncharacterized protein (DUF983 family)